MGKIDDWRWQLNEANWLHGWLPHPSAGSEGCDQRLEEHHILLLNHSIPMCFSWLDFFYLWSCSQMKVGFAMRISPFFSLFQGAACSTSTYLSVLQSPFTELCKDNPNPSNTSAETVGTPLVQHLFISLSAFSLALTLQVSHEDSCLSCPWWACGAEGRKTVARQKDMQFLKLH